MKDKVHPIHLACCSKNLQVRAAVAHLLPMLAVGLWCADSRERYTQ
jgi:hypothetical protein